MSKITFTFHRSTLQKAVMMYSAKLVIDNQDYMVAPDNSIQLELQEGIHDIRVSIPHQSNESYAVTSKINIQATTDYDITYSLSSMSYQGFLSVQEIYSGLNSSVNAPQKIKGRKTNLSLIVILPIVVLVVIPLIMFIGVNIRKSHNSAKPETAVTTIDTHSVKNNLEISATDIKVIDDSRTGK